jgi:hypothetical protein
MDKEITSNDMMKLGDIILLTKINEDMIEEELNEMKVGETKAHSQINPLTHNGKQVGEALCNTIVQRKEGAFITKFSIESIYLYKSICNLLSTVIYDGGKRIEAYLAIIGA